MIRDSASLKRSHDRVIGKLDFDDKRQGQISRIPGQRATCLMILSWIRKSNLVSYS